VLFLVVLALFAAASTAFRSYRSDRRRDHLRSMIRVVPPYELELLDHFLFPHGTVDLSGNSTYRRPMSIDAVLP
jgi:hypothetical protein